MKENAPFRLCAVVTLSVALSLPVALQAEPIRVMTEEGAPFQMLVDGEVRGINTDIVRAVFERAGVAGQFEVQPWARCFETALNEPDVAVFSVVRTADREELFEWIGPVIFYRAQLWKLQRRTEIELSSLDDAKTYVTGVVTDDIVEQYLASRGFEGGSQLDSAPRQNLNIRKLLRERIDLMVFNPIALRYAVDRMPGVDFEDLEPVFSFDDISAEAQLVCSRGTDPEVVAKLKKAFAECSADGSIESILEGHGVGPDGRPLQKKSVMEVPDSQSENSVGGRAGENRKP